MKITAAIAKQLEAFTLKHPDKVLMISTVDGDVEDQIVIFKGFSSSLMHPTDYNPDNQVFSEAAQLVYLDILASPYIPDNPVYIQKNMPWEAMAQQLADLNIT